MNRKFDLEDVFEVEKSSDFLLFSIQPRFSELIRRGTKTIELRKKKPKVVSKFAIVYESSPKQAASFLVAIERVESAPKKVIWQKYQDKCGVSRKFFNEYYKGSKEGVAILINEILPLDHDISRRILSEHGLTPPQDYRYVPKEMLRELVACAMGQSQSP